MTGAGAVAGRLARIGHFAVWYVGQLVRATASVGALAVRPRCRPRSVIVRVGLSTRGRRARVVIANLVSLTPGTLTVDVGGDVDWLYVHGLDVNDDDDVRSYVLDLERRVQEVVA